MEFLAGFFAFAAVALTAFGIAVTRMMRRPLPVPHVLSGEPDRLPTLTDVLGHMASSVFGAAKMDALRRKLMWGGQPHGWSAEQVTAFQVAAAAAGAFILLPLAWAGLGPAGILFGAFGALMGYMAPQAIVDRVAEARQRALSRDLPIVIDLIAVGVEAGMPMADAMRQVAFRMKDPMREELLRTVQDMIASTREQALSSMAERTGLADVARLAWILHQGDRYGVPVAETLRQYSADLRRSRSLDLQARAAALPVILIGPMLIFGVLPVMAIVLGPMALEVAKVFQM